MKAVPRCHCGQRISARDVMQRIRAVRRFGAPLVYIRYRCSRCRRLGEMYVRQDIWQRMVDLSSGPEVSPDERKRFDRMGPITEDEIARVRESSPDLDDLRVAEDN